MPAEVGIQWGVDTTRSEMTEGLRDYLKWKAVALLHPVL